MKVPNIIKAREVWNDLAKHRTRNSPEHIAKRLGTTRDLIVRRLGALYVVGAIDRTYEGHVVRYSVNRSYLSDVQTVLLPLQTAKRPLTIHEIARRSYLTETEAAELVDVALERDLVDYRTRKDTGDRAFFLTGVGEPVKVCTTSGDVIRKRAIDAIRVAPATPFSLARSLGVTRHRAYEILNQLITRGEVEAFKARGVDNLDAKDDERMRTWYRLKESTT